MSPIKANGSNSHFYCLTPTSTANMSGTKPTSPEVLKNRQAFQTMRHLHQKYAKYLGFGLPLKKALFLSLIYQSVSHMLLVSVLANMWYDGAEISFLVGLENATTIFGLLCDGYTGLLMLTNQDKINALLDYCETLSSSVEINESALVRAMRAVPTVSILVSLSGEVSTFFAALVFRLRLLPVPYYVSEKLVANSWLAYVTIFIHQCAGIHVFWLYYSFFFITYYILVQHLSTQYRILGASIKGLVIDGTQLHTRNFYKDINAIGRQHSDLLMSLTTANKILAMPLLLNEIVATMCATMSVALFVYDSDNAAFGFQCMAAMAGCLVYPYLGEYISSAANQFVGDVYESDWASFPAVLRKRVMLMLMMAQRPVGFSSGGFHTANYMEISQVKYVVEIKGVLDR